MRTFLSSSRFSHVVGWLHSLQSGIFLFLAQGRILHSSFPSPFRQPWHVGSACIDSSAFRNSLLSKSLAPHVVTP